jgi:nicotinamide mononucleotide (NMN) deamidase PncC
MPTRKIDVDGTTWSVSPSGYVTPYDQDEFGLIFVRGTGDTREMRVTRYSPQGSRSREQSLRELTDDQLRTLFAQSQPSFTSPEVGYAR